jgi:hypothetical protein
MAKMALMVEIVKCYAQRYCNSIDLEELLDQPQLFLCEEVQHGYQS